MSIDLQTSLFEQARKTAGEQFGNSIYIRGLIEISNYCKNNCFYCGIRAGNAKVHRYRLTGEQILDCCKAGYPLGFRTFVLQGGEDPFFTDDWLVGTVATIRATYPDCAITLSLGERSRPSYQALFDAGANRYLLRHETADDKHYSALHPSSMSLQHRKECLWTLKDIGYQVGTGFMVGSPGQTDETLEMDLSFIRELEPQMIGIGPFIPHRDTPFWQEPAGSYERTLELIAKLRIEHPKALIPATTSLGTIVPGGREMGILAGANVVMPNLSPQEARENYTLYNNKLHTGAESAEGMRRLKANLSEIGYQIVVDRGDYDV